MLALLTNDDGIQAPGLAALAQAIAQMAEVEIAAPEFEQSATGHSITLVRPLRVKEVELFGNLSARCVDGTPADCVKLMLSELMDRAPDIILSGINRGPNVGIDVFYSGTVAAALEGATYDVPSVAVSLDVSGHPSYDYAAAIAREVARQVAVKGLPTGTFLNVNVPGLPPQEVRGVKVTRQCSRRYDERFHRRTDPRGRDYYWLDGELHPEPGDTETDVAALRAGYVSITPLKCDLTHREYAQTVESWELDSILGR